MVNGYVRGVSFVRFPDHPLKNELVGGVFFFPTEKGTEQKQFFVIYYGMKQY